MSLGRYRHLKTITFQVCSRDPCSRSQVRFFVNQITQTSFTDNILEIVGNERVSPSYLRLPNRDNYLLYFEKNHANFVDLGARLHN